MRIIDNVEIELVAGGGIVDTNSTAYQVGKDVGTAVKDIGEIAGFIGAVIVVAGVLAA